MNNPSRLWLFSVEDSTAQLTWGSLPVGPTTVEIADSRVEFESNGGPGSATVTGLPAASTLDCIVINRGLRGGGVTREFKTLASPAGRELTRFATISDMHIGEVGFGWRFSITENPPPKEPFPIRATRAALRELVDWGAEMLVVKGDITASGRVGQWETFAQLIAEVNIPVKLITGNHDAGSARPVPPSLRSERAEALHGAQISIAEAFDRWSMGKPEAVGHTDLEGIRLVFTETDRTDRPDKRGGRIREHIDSVLDRIDCAPRPVMLIGHHQPMPLPFPYYLPRGIPMAESRELLRRARKTNPALIVTAGHTHRHRRRTMEGVTITEVGSVKDYPGTWAGYVVHESGIRQVVRRVSAPDVLTWTDRSAAAALGMWGRWSPGTIDDRCFTHAWGN